MGFFIGFLTVLLVIVSLLMVLLILMQRPKQEGLGAAFGGGMMDQAFGPSTTNVLQKGTVYLAIGFFVISMALAMLVNSGQVAKREREEEILSQIDIGRDDPADPSITAGDTDESSDIPDSQAPAPSPLPEDAEGPASASPTPQPENPAPSIPAEQPVTPTEAPEPAPAPDIDTPMPAPVGAPEEATDPTPVEIPAGATDPDPVESPEASGEPAPPAAQ